MRSARFLLIWWNVLTESKCLGWARKGPISRHRILARLLQAFPVKDDGTWWIRCKYGVSACFKLIA